MLCVVIGRVNMMSIRTFLLGGMTAAFAVGGFAVGSYRPQAQETGTLEIKAPDFQKVPRSRIGLVVIANAKRLGLSDAQVERVRKANAPWMEKERKQAEANWKGRVMTAEKVANGEWLPQISEFEGVIYGNEQKGAIFGNRFSWSGFYMDLDSIQKIKAVVGKKAIDQAISIGNGVAQEDGQKAFDFILDDSTLAKLALSPLQQKQFHTLKTRTNTYFSNPNRRFDPRSRVPVPNALIRPMAMNMAFGLLDMKQALVLDTMLWEKFCVRP